MSLLLHFSIQRSYNRKDRALCTLHLETPFLSTVVQDGLSGRTVLLEVCPEYINEVRSPSNWAGSRDGLWSGAVWRAAGSVETEGKTIHELII